MDENMIWKAAEAHGRAVREGDIEHIKADLIPELHVHIRGIADVVPSPLQSTRVEALEAFDDYAESIVAYSSPTDEVPLGGSRRRAPQIFESAPV